MDVDESGLDLHPEDYLLAVSEKIGSSAR